MDELIARFLIREQLNARVPIGRSANERGTPVMTRPVCNGLSAAMMIPTNGARGRQVNHVRHCAGFRARFATIVIVHVNGAPRAESIDDTPVRRR